MYLLLACLATAVTYIVVYMSLYVISFLLQNKIIFDQSNLKISNDILI